jgi:uncharacterized protein (DUF427 family)
MKAIYNSQIIAESDDTKVVESNHYFPPDSVNMEFLRPSDKHTTCPWKGVASYYNVVVNGETIEDAAWYYPTPKTPAEQIKGYVAFWLGVEVTE